MINLGIYSSKCSLRDLFVLISGAKSLTISFSSYDIPEYVNLALLVFCKASSLFINLKFSNYTGTIQILALFTLILFLYKILA
nr:MAG TPA: hypothetical protein [Bacteriophage sp.]